MIRAGPPTSQGIVRMPSSSMAFCTSSGRSGRVFTYTVAPVSIEKNAGTPASRRRRTARITRRVSGCQSTISPVPVIVIPWSMSVTGAARAQVSPTARFRIASSISAIRRGISARRAWKNGDVSASRCASSVCLNAGTRATIIAIRRSTPASWTAYESSSVSPIFHLLNPPVTDRVAEPAPRRAKREISSSVRRRPAAWTAAVASAANPEALAPSPIFEGKSFSLAIRNGSRIEARPRVGLTAARVRSLAPPVTSVQRSPVHVHVEGTEQEALRLVDVQELGEPAKEECRAVLGVEADFDLPHRFDGSETGDEAEHPFGGVREQLVQRGAVRADPDVGGVLDLLVPHEAAKRARR